jgi:hypothetical protein
VAWLAGALVAWLAGALVGPDPELSAHGQIILCTGYNYYLLIYKLLFARVQIVIWAHAIIIIVCKC